MNVMQLLRPGGIVQRRGLALALLCLGMVPLIHHLAHRRGLLEHVGDRLRFHAIPVALTDLYQGGRADYTAWKSLALPFQDKSRSIDALLAEYSRPRGDLDGTYFWSADDRGLADFAGLAFRLFGARVAALGRFTFVLLLVSVALFVLAYRDRPGALFLLAAFLTGLGFLVLLLDQAEGIADATGHVWQERLALFDSRFFEVLALPAVLHLILCGRTVPPLCGTGRRVADGLALAGQTGVLFFLLHARSSLGWQVLALALIALGGLGREARRWWQDRTFRFSWRPVLPLVCCLLGWLLLDLHRRAAYHPDYFAARGVRTVWHNVLMGLAYDPDLRDLRGYRVEDRSAIETVLAWMRNRRDPRLTPDWNPDHILCSLGSHTEFDWPAYEDAARATFFDLARQRPGPTLACFLIHKPRAILSHLGQAAAGFADGRNLPAALVLACLVALAGCMAFPAGRSEAGMRCRCSLLVLGVCAAVPPLVFYVALPTMGGLVVLTAAGMAFGLGRSAAWCLRRRTGTEPAPSPNTTVQLREAA